MVRDADHVVRGASLVEPIGGHEANLAVNAIPPFAIPPFRNFTT
jgi:hypothetical protein